MIKQFNQFINEEYLEGDIVSPTDENVYVLLYYGFDWDDNILHMPTEIIVLDNNGEEVGMSTQDFAEYRSKIGSEEFEYQGHVIVGFAQDAFRYFRDTVDPNIFEEDTKKALSDKMFAKSWNDFIECLTTGALFSIITARGHEPETIRKGVELIINGFDSTQRMKMIDHLKMFKHHYGQEVNVDENKLISDYLDLCEFIGVSAPSRGGSPDNPEKAKEESFFKFVEKCDNLAKELEVIFNQNSDEKWRVVAKVGFSDDDSKNVIHMTNAVEEKVKQQKVASGLHSEEYTNVKEFYIKNTGKEEIETSVHKYESKITKFKDFRLDETSNQTPGLESSVLASTQFGNMSGRLNPSGPINRQDDFFNQFNRQVDYLGKTTKEIKKDIRKNIDMKNKKSSK
jgi:hypothetical protein